MPVKNAAKPDAYVSMRVNPTYAQNYAAICDALAAQIGVPIVQAEAQAGELQIEVVEQHNGLGDGYRLFLHGIGAPFSLDFAATRRASKNDPLLKAIGRADSVIDATAGWGGDAVHLARHGINVIAVEKNPIVAAFLHNAHAACDDELKSRLVIKHADACDYLRELSLAPDVAPDVVYLDPMFPPSNHSAKPKKAAMLLRRLVGDDIANNETANTTLLMLLGCAIACAKKRVVVKRAHRAPPLLPNRVGCIKSKLLRFDIYHPQH